MSGFQYNKKLKATGDKVVLEITATNIDKTIGGIIVPTLSAENCRMATAKVLSIGPEAAKKNLKVGDTVRYDANAVYYYTAPIVVVKVENIITVEN